jgi:hypothetical protein
VHKRPQRIYPGFKEREYDDLLPELPVPGPLRVS